jgi:hypothetical protein
MLRSRSSRRSRRCSVHRRGNQPDRSLRGYTSGAARGAGWTGLPPFLETVRNRRPRSSFHALHESPPFDGLSANRGGEIRCRRSDLCRRQSTRDLLNPIRVAVHALTCIHLHSLAFRRFHLHSVALIPPHFVTATGTGGKRSARPKPGAGRLPSSWSVAGGGSSRAGDEGGLPVPPPAFLPSRRC